MTPEVLQNLQEGFALSQRVFRVRQRSQAIAARFRGCWVSAEACRIPGRLRDELERTDVDGTIGSCMGSSTLNSIEGWRAVDCDGGKRGRACSFGLARETLIVLLPTLSTIPSPPTPDGRLPQSSSCTYSQTCSTRVIVSQLPCLEVDSYSCCKAIVGLRHCQHN